MKKQPWTFYLLLMSLLGLVCSLFFATISNRHLYRDTARLLFQQLQYESWPVYGYRFFSTLTYIPNQILAAFFRQYEIVWLTNLTFGFTILFLQVASLAYCFFLLKNDSKKNLFLFPILGFSASTMITYAYTGCQLNEISFLFWPLIILIYLNRFTTQEKTLSIFFVLSLALTHELAIFQLSITFIYAFYKYYFEKKNKIFLQIILILLFISIPLCWARATYGIYPTRHEFYDFFKNFTEYIRTDSSLLYQLGLLLLLPIFLFNKQISFFVSLVLSIIALALYLEGSPRSALFNVANLRYLMPFTLAYISILFCFFAEKKTNLNFSKQLYFLCAISLIFSTHRDFKLTQEWNHEISLLQQSEELQKNHCADMIQSNLYFKDLSYMALEATYLSLMIQNQRKINYILAETMTSRCDEIAKENKITFLKNFSFEHDLNFFEEKYFDFTSLRKSATPTR